MGLDLAQFDEEFKPADPTFTQSKGLEDITDGSYVFEVTKCFLDVTKKSGDTLFKMYIKINGAEDASEYERPSFLTNQDNVNRLARELMNLGFDADKWSKKEGRPFSQEIQRCCRWLVGMRFHGTKKTNESKGKTYHNLYVNKRADDDKPKQVTREHLAEPDPDMPF